MDAFHTTFLLSRLRDPRNVSSGPDRIAKVQLRQAEVNREPHRIELRDALAAELLGLSARLYEDAREAHVNGFPDHVADQGLDMAHAMSMRALDEIDAMADLFLAETSVPRRTALRAGVGYNQTVWLLEFGRMDDARAHVATLRRELDEVAASDDPALTSIDGFVRDIARHIW